MDDLKGGQSMEFDLVGQAPRRGPALPFFFAALLTVLWGLCVFYFLEEGFGGEAGVSLVWAVVVGLPVVLIWLCAFLAWVAIGFLHELRRLDGVVQTVRRRLITFQRDSQIGLNISRARRNGGSDAARASDGPEPSASGGRDPEAEAGSPGFSQEPLLNSLNKKSEPSGEDSGQAAPRLPLSDLVRALNFPDGEKDVEGHRVLNRVLEDREHAKLLHAAEDVLSLLAEDGFHMDTLRVEHANPRIWRRYAKGERGESILSLGGVTDPLAHAQCDYRFKNDTVFRDTANQFARLFEAMLSSVVEEASDRQISDLADTRTGRAFMLVGGVSKAFT